jgi:type IV pilus assembly protein PilN
MMRVNFLPHREWALVRQQQIFTAGLLGATLLALVLAGALNAWWGQLLAAQVQSNGLLQKEIAVVQAQVQRRAQIEADLVLLNLRERAFVSLQQERQLPVMWLQEIERHLPEGLYLTSLKQEAQQVQIQGVAGSSEQVFELLRRMVKDGQCLTRPELLEVAGDSSRQDAAGPGGRPFSVRASLLRQANPPSQP